MSKNDSINIRVSKRFEEWLRSIQVERLKNGKDKKPKTPSRLTLAITRLPEFPDITKKMATFDMLDNSRGQTGVLTGAFFGLLLVVVLAFVITMFFSTFQYAFNTMTTQLVNMPNNALNVTGAMQTTFGNVNAAISQLQWWSYIIIFGMIIGLFIAYYLVTKIHPAWFVAWVLLVAVVVIFSIIISNSFSLLYGSPGVLGTTLQGYTAASFILLHLPEIVTVIGFIGGILLFVGINRSIEEGQF